MNNRVFISDEELKKYGEINNLSQKAEALLNHQKENWELLRNNFDALKNIKISKYSFNEFEIRTQFNPSRIISSSAKVDKNSIRERPCFLCEKNLPEVQRGIKIYDNYTLLCNPYPIFSQHLTIPHHEHIPQSIESSFKDFLNITYKLRHNFLVFYNGPKCGASAPDHLHFQAGIKNTTPLEVYYDKLFIAGHSLLQKDDIKIKRISSDIMNFIIIRSNNEAEIFTNFFRILDKFKKSQYSSDEPLLNIIGLYENNEWNIFIFPRKAHRPKEYFLEGNEKLLISPASADMAGLLITPREIDYNNLSKENVINIYGQVLINRSEFEILF